MKNSRKIKKRFLALLGCAALGAVLAPAALAAEDLAAPAAGDPFRQYLPLIIGRGGGLSGHRCRSVGFHYREKTEAIRWKESCP